MKYAAHQINTERDTGRLLFMSFDAMIRHAGRIPMEIFEELNVRREKHPEFRGHSLSVSDVIELNGALWFCDSIGFRKFRQGWRP